MARILIIDDDPSLRRTLGRILERAGHHVDVAPNGVRGMEMFTADPADVVITDLIMPEKEGIETIQELRDVSAAVRIIAISGYGGYEDGCLQDAELLGADASLMKPFRASDLVGVVLSLLGTENAQTVGH